MEPTIPLTIQDVYWKSENSSEDKMRIMPVNRGKKLFVETDCPEEPHQDYVVLRFCAKDSVLENDYKEIKLKNRIEIEVDGEKRYRFEMPYAIAHDLLQINEDKDNG